MYVEYRTRYWVLLKENMKNTFGSIFLEIKKAMQAANDSILGAATFVLMLALMNGLGGVVAHAQGNPQSNPLRFSTKEKFVPKLNLCAKKIVRLSNGTTYFVGDIDERRPSNTSGMIKLDPAHTLSDINVGSGVYGVAKDYGNNVYIEARGSILKIAPNGKISTLAGRAVPIPNSEEWRDRDVDGVGEKVRFSSMRNITADVHGNVYVQESPMPYAYIRKIDRDGKVTTVFKGKVSKNTNNFDRGAFAVDSKGNIFLGSSGAIMKVDVHGSVGVFAGNEDESLNLEAVRDGQGRDARFGTFIASIAIDPNDYLYVTTTSYINASSLRKISPGGWVSTLFDLRSVKSKDFVDGDVVGNRIDITSGIDVDNEGNVYFADCGNNAYRVITSDSKVSTFIRGNVLYQDRF